jgi:hypothetical protein
MLCQMNMLHRAEITEWLWVFRFERQRSVAATAAVTIKNSLRVTEEKKSIKLACRWTKNSKFELPVYEIALFIYFIYRLFNTAFNISYNTASTNGISD